MATLFTATRTQALTYLLGVCLFSIAFLVFVNSSVSFVITGLIKQRAHVGNSVGSLGFADELVAVVACPAWGVISDRLGVRRVCSLGYAIIGIALLLFVQARNVYPDLLLARLLFSLGGAATSTMVTAILPAMLAQSSQHTATASTVAGSAVHDIAPSISSELTITPNRLQSRGNSQISSVASSPSRLAGIVGLFTGYGALLALGLLLRLPELFQRVGLEPSQSLSDSYYIVGALALMVSLICFIGLRHLNGEEGKGWRALLRRETDDQTLGSQKALTSLMSLVASIKLGVQNPLLALGYLGGFVARASSVGISLFIPLYVNAYYISSGMCDEAGHNPQDVKEKCRGAYVLAAELTGVSQLVALLFAPIFGYLADRYRRFNIPLLMAALFGCFGYVGLAMLETPAVSGQEGSAWVFVIMSLLGLSQIGAIVCSLGLLGHCVVGLEERSHDDRDALSGFNAASTTSHNTRQVEEDDEDCDEVATLLGPKPPSSTHLKGSIAGVYSLFGAVGILILTKVGGILFDRVSQVAPFYMLALFNMLLLIAVVVLGIFNDWTVR